MKEKIKIILYFIGKNWFKIGLLIAVFWFLFVLTNGIEVNYSGKIDHSGWIENESPWPNLLPKINF